MRVTPQECSCTALRFTHNAACMLKKPSASIPRCAHSQDVAMHATRPLVASALVDGCLRLDAYGPEGLSPGHRVKAFDQASCRAIAFAGSEAGADLLLASSSTGELALVDVGTGRVQLHLPDAHEQAITCCRALDGSLMACGACVWKWRGPGFWCTACGRGSCDHD